jgi:hypothetical protein
MSESLQMQILDDTFSAALSGHCPIKKWVDLIIDLDITDKQSYVFWNTYLTQLHIVGLYLSITNKSNITTKHYIAHQFYHYIMALKLHIPRTLLLNIGITNNNMQIRESHSLRALLVAIFALYEDTDIIKLCLSIRDKYKHKHLYPIIAAHDTMDDFTTLINMCITEGLYNELFIIFGLIKDNERIKYALDLILGDIIKPHDLEDFIHSLSLNSHAINNVWDFIIEKWDSLPEQCDKYALLKACASEFNHHTQLDKFNKFFANNTDITVTKIAKEITENIEIQYRCIEQFYELIYLF